MIRNLTVKSLSDKLASKEISAFEACKAYLDRIEEIDRDINAYITVTAGSAMEKAADIDRQRKNGGALSCLAGVPSAVKDNICTAGVKTTCASKMLEEFIPPYSATVYDRLCDAGAINLGKLNMDEFAMGSSSETSAFGCVKNPIDTSRVPGGSSGGSAAAVAAGEAAFTLGTDTGGSIRIPAAYCGVVGMKPTYGAVSRNGVVPLASSLDQIGAITKDVYDCAMVHSVICGHDPKDSTSLKHNWDFLAGIDEGVKGMKIALPKEFFDNGISADVKSAIENAAKIFESLGGEVEEVSMPGLKGALAAYYVISGAEASSNLARFDGIHYGRRAQEFEDMEDLYKSSRSQGFGSEVKRRIMLGTFVLSAGYYDAYYKKAQQVRTLISAEFGRVFGTYDIILSPVTPGVAYKIGEITSPMEMYMGDMYTVPVNLAGLPAMSLPCGKGAHNMPVAMQLISRAFGENNIFRSAYAFEQAVKGGQK